MNRVILHCPPKGRLHFGRVALGENMSLSETALLPHSDTLFSAIISTAASIDAEMVPPLLAAFSDGTVQLSSGNFCLECTRSDSTSGWIYFLPKPAHIDLWKVPPPQPRKGLHRIKFISEGTWLAGDPPVAWLDPEHYTILPGGFVITQTEAALLPYSSGQNAVYQILDLPKVRVHHENQEGGFFNQTSVQLAAVRTPNGSYRAHYYLFLHNELKGDLARLFRSVLALFPDQGIGGERRTGCGTLAEVSYETPGPLPALVSDWKVGLSLTCPASEAELQHCAYYQPVLRGGRRIAAQGAVDVHLKRVRMLREGSVLTGPVTGRIVDITPQAGATHPYLRSGRCFSLPLHPNLSTNVFG